MDDVFSAFVLKIITFRPFCFLSGLIGTLSIMVVYVQKSKPYFHNPVLELLKLGLPSEKIPFGTLLVTMTNKTKNKKRSLFITFVSRGIKYRNIAHWFVVSIKAKAKIENCRTMLY